MDISQEIEGLRDTLRVLQVEAKKFEDLNTELADRLAKTIRKQLDHLSHQLKMAEDRPQRAMRAREKMKYMEEQGAKLAASIRYRVHILSLMQESGTFSDIARDLNIREGALELYTVIAIKKHQEHAVQAELERNPEPIDVDLRGLKKATDGSWQTYDRTRMYERPKAMGVRKLLSKGLSASHIEKVSGLSKAQINYIYTHMSPTERQQRNVAVSAKAERKRQMVLRLWRNGHRKADICREVRLSDRRVSEIISDAS